MSKQRKSCSTNPGADLGNIKSNYSTTWVLARAKDERARQRQAKYEAAATDPDVARCRDARTRRLEAIGGRVVPRSLAEAKQAFDEQMARHQEGRRTRNGRKGITMRIGRPAARAQLTEGKRILASIDAESVLMRARGIGLGVGQELR